MFHFRAISILKRRVLLGLFIAVKSTCLRKNMMKVSNESKKKNKKCITLFSQCDR